MYVCICNAISERTVRETIAAGCRSVSEVYRRQDCRPQCGRCVPEMRKMLRAEGAIKPANGNSRTRRA